MKRPPLEERLKANDAERRRIREEAQKRLQEKEPRAKAA